MCQCCTTKISFKNQDQESRQHEQRKERLRNQVI
jgi:hypothetical protein